MSYTILLPVKFKCDGFQCTCLTEATGTVVAKVNHKGTVKVSESPGLPMGWCAPIGQALCPCCTAARDTFLAAPFKAAAAKRQADQATRASAADKAVLTTRQNYRYAEAFGNCHWCGAVDGVPCSLSCPRFNAESAERES